MPLQHRFPRLFSYVKDALVSVKDGFSAHDLISWFHLPLSEQAHNELLVLKSLMLPNSFMYPGSLIILLTLSLFGFGGAATP